MAAIEGLIDTTGKTLWELVEERAAAVALPRALGSAARLIENGTSISEAIEPSTQPSPRPVLPLPTMLSLSTLSRCNPLKSLSVLPASWRPHAWEKPG